MLWKLNKEIKTSQLFFMALCAERSDGMEVKMEDLNNNEIHNNNDENNVEKHNENEENNIEKHNENKENNIEINTQSQKKGESNAQAQQNSSVNNNRNN